jgi:hypothetical protein
VSTLDPRLAERLDRLVPERPAVGDWDTIVRGARRRARRRRLVQLATAAVAFALGVSPVGGAIVRSVGDFSAWLSGEPGTPAAESDQQAFERSNDRSWAGFPPGTELRSLIKTDVGGHEVELFGFRSGDSLCLRVVARGLNGSPALSCAPLAALQRAGAPVVVVQADHPIGLATSVPAGGGYVAPEAQASFGIVADGVRRVELRGDDGTHDAIVKSNAFLYVDDKPKVGARVRAVFAIGGDGTRKAVPFQPAPFGEHHVVVPTHHDATGPVMVQRVVEGGTIGWLVRREPRGESPSSSSFLMRVFVDFEFARLLTPDPASHVRILLGVGTPRHGPDVGKQSGVCFYRVAGGSAGGGCSSFEALFSLAPFNVSEESDEGGDQFTNLSGLASDDVARLQIFLGTGERQPIPLRDNAWVMQVARADYPIRVVAYDSEGRIIGIQTIETP